MAAPRVHFLDFETVATALPLYETQAPYGALPFQFSLHTVDAGRLRAGKPVMQCISGHQEHLADGRGDPTPGFLAALEDALGGDDAKVVVYSGYEKAILRKTAKGTAHERFARDLADNRFFDLREVFTAGVVHPEMNGSTSIKAVLPAYEPRLSYGGLEVQGGTEAMAAWLKMRTAPAAERKALAQGLLEYCRLDTKAMIYVAAGVLRERARGAAGRGR